MASLRVTTRRMAFAHATRGSSAGAFVVVVVVIAGRRAATGADDHFENRRDGASS